MATKTDELYELLLSKGYPQPFCQEIAYHTLNTDFTATRMIRAESGNGRRRDAGYCQRQGPSDSEEGNGTGAGSH